MPIESSSHKIRLKPTLKEKAEYLSARMFVQVIIIDVNIVDSKKIIVIKK